MRSIHNLLLLAILFYPAVPVFADDVRLGILAVRGNEKAVMRWYPLAEYLKNQMPRHVFHIVPLNLKEMRSAVLRRQVDFVFTNTGNYVELEANHGINCIATLINQSQGKPTTQYGSVVFTRAGRTDIENFHHLKGKIVMGVAKGAFGGFQMAWREFKRQGIDPFKSFNLRFSGLPQDQIVYAVRDGLVDAGIVRTGTLERMDAEGLVSMNQFTIINARRRPGTPFVSSTKLYPEWPFAKLPHVSERLAKQVAVALLTMKKNHGSARIGKYAGWTVPLDYSDVHQLFRELKVGPYAEKPKQSIDLVSTALYAAAVVILFFGVYLFTPSGRRLAGGKRRKTRIHRMNAAKKRSWLSRFWQKNSQ